MVAKQANAANQAAIAGITVAIGGTIITTMVLMVAIQKQKVHAAKKRKAAALLHVASTHILVHATTKIAAVQVTCM